MGKKYKFKEPNGSGAFEIEIETPLIGPATWKLIGGTSPFVGDLTAGTARETGNDIALVGTDFQTFFTIKNAKFSDPEGKRYEAECELCEGVGGPFETPKMASGPSYYDHDNCFLGNTLVHMADGSFIAIRDVKVGDAIMGAGGTAKVSENRKSRHENYLEVVLSNDTILHVSWGQEFGLPDGDSVAASHLHIGQYLSNLDGTEVRVAGLRMIPAPAEMFDLQTGDSAKTNYAVTIQRLLMKIKP